PGHDHGESAGRAGPVRHQRLRADGAGRGEVDRELHDGHICAGRDRYARAGERLHVRAGRGRRHGVRSSAAMKIAAVIAFVASAVSAVQSGAAERFRPAAPEYVVLRVPARALNDPITLLEQRRAQAPSDQAITAELAALYVERARAQREARYFGRAE